MERPSEGLSTFPIALSCSVPLYYCHGVLSRRIYSLISHTHAHTPRISNLATAAVAAATTIARAGDGDDLLRRLGRQETRAADPEDQQASPLFAPLIAPERQKKNLVRSRSTEQIPYPIHAPSPTLLRALSRWQDCVASTSRRSRTQERGTGTPVIFWAPCPNKKEKNPLVGSGYVTTPLAMVKHAGRQAGRQVGQLITRIATLHTAIPSRHMPFPHALYTNKIKYTPCAAAQAFVSILPCNHQPD